MQQRERAIYEFYRKNVRGLLGEVTARNEGKTPANCMNEVRALTDHIARCYLPDQTEQKKNEELSKAEGHLRRLTFDCFKQLNIFMYDNLQKMEKTSFTKDWFRWDGGSFWVTYSENRKCAKKSVVEAKQKESIDSEEAMKLYNVAHDSYMVIEELLNKYSKQIFKAKWKHWLIKRWNFVKWIWWTFIISVFGGLIFVWLTNA
jgi:hypothetical protein